MPQVKISRIKQRFARVQMVTVTSGEQKAMLRSGETITWDLPAGEHRFGVRSGFGSGTAVLNVPEQREVEIGFTVTDEQMRKRLWLILALLALTLFMVFYLGYKWAPLLILIGTIPTIVANRKALYVDVVEPQAQESAEPEAG